MKKAVLLFSGGLDSSTVLAHIAKEAYEIYALTFDYGQKHIYEIQAAKKLANHYSVKEHLIIKIDLQVFGGSALTKHDLQIPTEHRFEEISEGIPITYVPARNTIFLSYAIAWAEVIESDEIFIGVNSIDYSGYPDCRIEFISAFQIMANLATKRAVSGEQKIKIQTPLIELKKSEIIRFGINLGLDYKNTFSCYDPSKNGHPCRKCDACRLRLAGFKELGLNDPLIY